MGLVTAPHRPISTPLSPRARQVTGNGAARRYPVCTEAVRGASETVAKYRHEFRDPIHQFIIVSSDERSIIDSSPVQRLREIHQLAMSYLVYPGATHRRFEHSLGVMELAGQVFDVLVHPRNLTDEVRDLVPEVNEPAKVQYGRQIVRLAGLLHDIGHLPFSHAVEHDLLPAGRGHEDVTVDLVRSNSLRALLEGMMPPVNAELVAKVAVGPKHWTGGLYSVWEALLSEIITGDAFGADRMDYLMRDSLHAGVAYGRFDLHRLVQSLRILSLSSETGDDEGPPSPAIGLDEGGLHTAEALLLARYFMFTQVYFHRVRAIYDQHLLDFLTAWLPGGQYPAALEAHLSMTDSHVLVAMRESSADIEAPGHEPARRIMHRDHYRRLYEPSPPDAERCLEPADAVERWARGHFGDQAVRRVRSSKGAGAMDFPVRSFDGRVGSSLSLSAALQSLPDATYDGVFIDGAHHEDATRELARDLFDILDSYPEGEA